MLYSEWCRMVLRPVNDVSGLIPNPDISDKIMCTHALVYDMRVTGLLDIIRI